MLQPKRGHIIENFALMELNSRVKLVPSREESLHLTPTGSRIHLFVGISSPQRLNFPIHPTGLCPIWPLFLPAPDFVNTISDEDYVYFFFREQAVEYINCGKVKMIYLVFFFEMFL